MLREQAPSCVPAFKLPGTSASKHSKCSGVRARPGNWFVVYSQFNKDLKLK